MQYFRLSFLITIIGLAVAYFWGGIMGAFIAFILAVLEVSLSFDNAVVNASILKHMFLTSCFLFFVFLVADELNHSIKEIR